MSSRSDLGALVAFSNRRRIDEVESEIVAANTGDLCISVKDELFGAVGDDVADDTTAILAALSYALTNHYELFFPPGTYRFAANLAVTFGIRIRGAGRSCTVLKDTRTNGGTSITVSADGGYLGDFTLVGNESLGCGIDLSNVYGRGTTLERLVIGSCFAHTPRWGYGNSSNTGRALKVTTSRYVRAYDCVIGDNYNGLEVTQTSDPIQEPNVVNFHSCDFEHNVHYGVYWDGIINAPVFFGGTFQYNGLAFYSKVTGNQIKLENTYLEANGFYIEGGYNAVLHISNCGHALTAQRHTIKGVQGISLRGFLNNPAQTEYSGVESIYMDPNCSFVTFEGFTCTERNIHTNGGFEGSPFNTGFTTLRATVTDETVDIIEGAHACKVTANDAAGQGTSALVYAVPSYADYAGKTVTLGAWVKAPSTNVLNSFMQIHSASGYMTQYPIPKDDTWHYFTVAHVVSATPSDLNIFFFVKNSATANTTDVLYVDDVVFNITKNRPLRYPTEV